MILSVQKGEFREKIIKVTVTFPLLSYSSTVDAVCTQMLMVGETTLTQVVGQAKKWDYSAEVVKRYLAKVGESRTWLQHHERLK